MGKPELQPETIEIDKLIWDDLKDATPNNIRSILKSVKVLLDSNIQENKEALFDHPYVAAGLYTYAIEEYGTLLILKSYKVSEGKVKIRYRNEFLKHYEKFRVAIQSLPKECLYIGKPLFDPIIFNPKIFDTDATIADFESRMLIFYSDLEGDKMIKLLPFVESDSLKKAISKFSEIVNVMKN